MRSKLIVLIKRLHILIFNHPMSPEMKTFLGNLSWSFWGGGFASLILMAVSIMGGRYMGPESYGRYVLILTYSQFLVIAIFLGLDTAGGRSISISKTYTDKAKNISSFFSFVILNTVFVSALLLTFRKVLFERYSLDPTMLWLLLLFTVAFVLKTTLDFSIRSIMLFKIQFIGRIVEAVGVIVFFVIFFFILDQQNYSHYTYAIVIGAGLASIFYLKTLIPFLGKFDMKYLKNQFNYAKLILFNTILGTVLASLDKIVIAKYLNLFELGIYAAYYSASIVFITQITKMFNNVLFPSATNIKDKTFVLKINKLTYIIFFPLILTIMVITFVILKMYGNKYGINWNYILGFSLLTILNSLSSIYNSILIGLSKKSYKKYIFYNNIFNILNLLGYGLIIYFKSISIELILVLLCINNLATIILQKNLIGASIKGQPKETAKGLEISQQSVD